MAKKRRKRTSEAGRGPGARGGDGASGGAPEIPSWLPALVFVGLTLVLFQGFVFSDQMLLGNDTLGAGYAARAFFADALRSLGTIPDWAPLILGGTPFLEALSAGDALYPPSLLLLLLTEPYRALGWKLVLHVAVAGFLMYAWIRTLGGSKAAALVAGTGYMLAPFFVSLVHPGHDGKMFVTALAPLLFLVVERHFSAPRLGAAAAIALVVGLIVLTTHFQMAYFLFGAVGLFGIFRAWEVGSGRTGGPEADDGAAPAATRRRPRAAIGRFALFLAASVAGLGVAAVQFLPAVDYVTESSRRVATTRAAAGEASVEWSSSWSMHPEEAMSLLIPEFPGANTGEGTWSANSYWGRNFFKHNSEYIGLVLLLLASVAFVRGGARPALVAFFAGVGGVALLFALGANTPVWRIFYEVVPGVRLFRAPSQVIFLTGFAVATLAGLGVDRLLGAEAVRDRETSERIGRILWVGAGVMGVLLLAIGSGVLQALWTSIVYPSIAADRLAVLQSHQPALVQGAGTALLLAVAVAGLVTGFRSGRLPAGGLVAGLVLLVAVDEARVDRPFIQLLDFYAWSAPDAHVQAIRQREAASGEPFRLLSFVQAGQDVRPTLHGIELAGGHHPNDLNRYRELIGMVGSGEPRNLYNGNVRRLLNVRYILWPDYQRGPAPEGSIVSRLEFSNGQTHSTLLAEGGLARARLVGAAVVVPEAEAVPYMLSEAFDPAAEVVLAEESPIALGGEPVEGSVIWLERTPNLLRLRTSSDRAALLVVADNWYPAWRARVDDVEAPVLRAYHTLRAIPVPAGEHTVEMTYESRLVAVGWWISLVSLLAAIGALVWDLRLKRAGTEASS